MSGDFVVHGLASDDPDKSDWDALKETIKASVDRVKAAFPKSLIIPCVGNNDVTHHYQVPSESEKNQYYSDLFNIWF